MRTITIINDWKSADSYMAVMQGILTSGDNDVRVVEISGKVETFKIEQAAYILRSCYRYYPPGTIHLIAVKTESDHDGGYLAAAWESQFFLFADNGFATLFWPDEIPSGIRAISITASTTFPEADILAQAALAIHQNNDLPDYPEYTGSHYRKTLSLPWFEDQVMTGLVIHSDSYGNAITNISQEYFNRHLGGKRIRIVPGNSYYPINEISTRYRDVSPSDQLALFNSAGMLEIAIRNGSARELLALKEGTNIRIETI